MPDFCLASHGVHNGYNTYSFRKLLFVRFLAMVLFMCDFHFMLVFSVKL